MRKLLPLLLICLSFFSYSQKLEYQFNFKGIADNREFASQFAVPQTIFGARGAFEIGLREKHHRIRIGLTHFTEFGSSFDALKPQLTLYYQYKDAHKSFLFGAFPRKKRTNLPLAMLQRTELYFQPNIEGIFTKIHGEWGFQDIFADWLTRQTNTKREEFMVATSGNFSYQSFFIENTLLMIHSMTPKISLPDDYINDYAGAQLLIGIQTKPKKDFYGYVKTGLLASSHKNRGVTNKFHFNTSSFTEAYGKYKNYALKSVLHTGNGHDFMLGDPFYKNDSYSRTDFVWHFINKKKVKGAFTYSFHLINWKHLNHQQMLTLQYVIGK